MSSTCGSWCAVGQTLDGDWIALPVPCNSWLCPNCAVKLKRALLKRLEGTTVHAFLTLTANPRAHATPDAAYAAMNAAIPHLFKRIRRFRPTPRTEYFLVWEWTARGWPHAHLLLRGPFLPQRWLSKQWRELTAAPIIDVRRVSTAEGAVNYLAKYLTKSLSVPEGHRRYRMSRRFLAPPVKCAAALRFGVIRWYLQAKTVYEFLADYRRLGFTAHLKEGFYGFATLTRPAPGA